MPTRAGVATAIVGILCLVAGRVFGMFELYIVAAAVLALVLCAIAWVLLNWRSLQVSRAVVPSRLHVGSTSVVPLTLSNKRLIPSPVAQITDQVDGTPRADAHVPPLIRNRSTRASYRVPAEQRGHIAIGPMKTRVTDPFALASAVRLSAPDASVLVLPAYDVIAAPPQPSGRVASRADRSPGRIGAQGDEFSSLRGYVMGDDLRKVHWPTTARTGELVVRTEHVPEHGDSLVLLDVRDSVATAETFERMVSAATSVLIACFERGDDVRLKTTAGDDLAAETQTAFDAMVDHLALVRQVADNAAQVADSSTGTSESAVVILGSSDAFMNALGTRQGLPPDTIALRFVDSEAKPTGADAALPSRRMAVIGPTDEFAALWASLVGRRPRAEAPAL